MLCSIPNTDQGEKEESPNRLIVENDGGERAAGRLLQPTLYVVHVDERHGSHVISRPNLAVR